MLATRNLGLLLLIVGTFSACSLSHRIQKVANETVLHNPALETAHVGISIYEPATGRWWYNWQGDKYFVPASNVKIATCYAALKHLGDSLVGARYRQSGGVLTLKPSGDPTFLHPGFARQPVLDLLRRRDVAIGIQDSNAISPLGSGWSWDDYDQAYLSERSALPVYGNVVWIGDKPAFPPAMQADTAVWMGGKKTWILPALFAPAVVVSEDANKQRAENENRFFIKNAGGPVQIPFITSPTTTVSLLQLLTGKPVTWSRSVAGSVADTVVFSQPTDSLLRPMMHRSDNFFAEQALLMVSNRMLGLMSDEKVIDTLLKTDFRSLPHPPRWVDGSGLSRYNLFTPQDFVAILQAMSAEFGMDRLRTLFAAGGTGTLSNFYKAEKPYLYAKTGTLSGVVALSGYLTTAKGKELIVSVLVNNHRSGAVTVRRAVEQFLQKVQNAY